MDDQNTLVFVALLLVLGECVNNIVHAKISLHKLQDKDEYFTVLDWKPISDLNLGRFKRNINIANRHRRSDTRNGRSTGDESNTLISSTFYIPDETHSQAVVSWSGRNSSVVFLLTRDTHLYGFVENSTLWRSEDYGTSFTRINFSSNAVVQFIYKSPVNKDKIILTDQINPCLYISEDEGKTWITSQIGFEPEKLYMHPTLENWVLGYTIMTYRLYVSSDFGKTWTLLKEDVAMQIYWAVEGEDDNPLTVHVEYQNLMEDMNSEYLSCIAPTCIDNTPDKSVGKINFNSLRVLNEYIFVQKSSYTSHDLYVSYKRGPFRKAYFPLNVHPKDFDIIETSENQVFIAADHKENMVTLYLSDVTGQFYVPSLERVVADVEPGYLEVDIYKVKGIKGRYIANQYGTIGNSTVMKTFISYDKGGKWVPIEVSKDQKSKCVDPNFCSLHIHLAYSHEYYLTPEIETEEGAPWLIFAHGSIGNSLKPDQAELYVSRDAGLTWSKPSLDGQYRVNIIDHGGAITAIQYSNKELTNVIHFSSDEGDSWQKHQFADKEIYVDGILNSPDITTLVVSVFGRLGDEKGRLMVKLDFSQVLTRQCTQMDYLDWSPGSNISQDNCILGQAVTYERRNQFSRCYNGPDYIRKKPASICLCRPSDFECDYGYEKTITGGCSPTNWYDHSNIHWHCHEGEMYNKTRGYRLIASDKCTGGLSTSSMYQPIPTPCPVAAPRGLMLSTPKTTVALGTTATFTLTQKSGSKLGTTYTWSFSNNGRHEVNTGLANATRKYHRFNKAGDFNVTVIAMNSNGSAVCRVLISVEANITAVLALAPWGAEVGRLTQFNVTLCCSGNQTDFGPTHFVWRYGDEPEGAHPYLTWGTTVSHRFNKTGQYNVTVQAVNSVSSVLTTYPINVYNNITIVRLHFTPNIDHFSAGSFDWRYTTSQLICLKLSELLYVQSNRLMVSIPQIRPTIADLTILPNQHGGLSVEQVVKELQQKVSLSQIRFQLITADDAIGIKNVEIIKGNVTSWVPASLPTVPVSTLSHVHSTDVTSPASVPVSVYIIVPLIVIAVGALVAVLIVYVKRKHKQDARYSLIMNRQQGATVLEVDDDDDEDFMGGGENIFESPDGDNNIMISSVHNPTLVMMTPSQPSNTVNC
ncbi:VPS10 domain-containing receptor SorCS1-like [Pecten maximus]|uniref:VPS10 domain-containing receptor SorCS1-like n=1 Tax=Pecten maximus TaxID=6579 RepID=UPI00145828B3|nr:VPS10 domain-containing receptor SorCS1-like [Pecten maximus]